MMIAISFLGQSGGLPLLAAMSIVEFAMGPQERTLRGQPVHAETFSRMLSRARLSIQLGLLDVCRGWKRKAGVTK